MINNELNQWIPQRGGAKINGIVETYGTNPSHKIDAGDFVDLFAEWSSSFSMKSINSGRTENIKAIPLSDDRVLLIFSYAEYYIISALVVKIVGDVQTRGVVTTVASANYSGYNINPVLLNDGRVFIAYPGNPLTYQVYGALISIDDLQINVLQTNVRMDSRQYSASNLGATLMPNGNVLVGHGDPDVSQILKGIIVGFENNTINILQSGISISTETYSSIGVNFLPLGDNRIYVSHGYNSSSKYLYGMVLSFDGNSITRGPDTLLIASMVNETPYLMRLENGDIIIFHCYSNNSYLYGLIIRIDGSVITKGNDTVINNAVQSGVYPRSVLLPSGKILLAYGVTAYQYLKAHLLSVNGLSFTYETVRDIISGDYTGISDIMTTKSGIVRLFHSYGGSRDMYRTDLYQSYAKRSNGKSPDLIGVAKSNSLGEHIEVYVPKTY